MAKFGVVVQRFHISTAGKTEYLETLNLAIIKQWYDLQKLKYYSLLN